MLSLGKVIFLLTVGLSLAQRRSFWKRYTNIPGTLNCRIEADIIYRLSSAGFQHQCVARIANNTDIYPGYLFRHTAESSVEVRALTRSGDWIREANWGDVEVLDVDPSLFSWIPIAFNPSESVLVQPEVPYSSEPKSFICRTAPHIFARGIDSTGYVMQSVGVMRNRVCYTGNWQPIFESNFEVLALNERAKMYYDFGYSGQNIESNKTFTGKE